MLLIYLLVRKRHGDSLVHLLVSVMRCMSQGMKPSCGGLEGIGSLAGSPGQAGRDDFLALEVVKSSKVGERRLVC